jgi:hypothetical protein
VVNSQIVVQSHTGNPKFWDCYTAERNRGKAAKDAGFDASEFPVRALEQLHEIFWRLIIHMSSTGNAEKRSAISYQLSAISRQQNQKPL